jgi:hypothetical protein
MLEGNVGLVARMNIAGSAVIVRCLLMQVQG